MGAQGPWRPEEGSKSPGAGVLGGGEQLLSSFFLLLTITTPQKQTKQTGSSPNQSKPVYLPVSGSCYGTHAYLKTHYISQTGFKLVTILLLPPPECWD